MRARARTGMRRAVVPAAALLVALTAGCARHTGGDAGAPPASSSAAPSAGASAGSSGSYAEMQKKLDDVQSALTAADRDATSSADR
ncbi:hypothetical protein [Streptomyces tropicalis]|uniref:Uncharacterized protein n=1 Tax=Streptomyces tropicalis TaxID=3034234 RepID=A0ABT5ZZL8_9ACTN|nr:hypothetical protein [Streptomyces tropicalis]MDF3297834.1 hypothetical protein [Streptomyces tropicalis]